MHETCRQLHHSFSFSLLPDQLIRILPSTLPLNKECIYSFIQAAHINSHLVDPGHKSLLTCLHHHSIAVHQLQFHLCSLGCTQLYIGNTVDGIGHNGAVLVVAAGRFNCCTVDSFTSIVYGSNPEEYLLQIFIIPEMIGLLFQFCFNGGNGADGLPGDTLISTLLELVAVCSRLLPGGPVKGYGIMVAKSP